MGLKAYFLDISEHLFPKFPKSVVGSLAHTHNSAIGCIAFQSTYLSLGIDQEYIISSREDAFLLSCLCLSEKEKEWAQEKDYCKRVTLLFSIKESFYKAFYFLHQIRVDLKEVEVIPRDHSYEICSKNIFSPPGMGPYNISVGVQEEEKKITTCVGIKKK